LACFLPNTGSVKPYFLIFIAAFWLLVHIPLMAQKPTKKFKKGGLYQLEISLTNQTQYNIFLPRKPEQLGFCIAGYKSNC